MENNSNLFGESSVDNNQDYRVAHIYTAEEIVIILGGIGALIASFVYALKNVNHLKSGCCECQQEVEHIVIDNNHIDNNQISNV
tara:strand:- start:6539 stop:6790 length:252 start_codon:yes stop_codon:yes gene_type:complete